MSCRYALAKLDSFTYVTLDTYLRSRSTLISCSPGSFYRSSYPGDRRCSLMDCGFSHLDRPCEAREPGEGLRTVHVVCERRSCRRPCSGRRCPGAGRILDCMVHPLGPPPSRHHHAECHDRNPKGTIHNHQVLISHSNSIGRTQRGICTSTTHL